MNIELVQAKLEHCDLIFTWANDVEVRINSFDKDTIQYEKHVKWFENKLNSNSTYMFICYINNKIPIGQIRLDIKDGVGLIDYSIAKQYRGKGYGTWLLTEIFNEIKHYDIKINKLVGKVKYNNDSSNRAFEKARYNKVKKEDYIEYYKNNDSR